MQQWWWYSSPLLSPSVGVPPTSPPHEQWLKELGVGGVSSAVHTHNPPYEQQLIGMDHVCVRCCTVLPADFIVSDVATVEVSRGTYLAGIPLHGSPGTHLLSITFSTSIV